MLPKIIYCSFSWVQLFSRFSGTFGVKSQKVERAIFSIKVLRTQGSWWGLHGYWLTPPGQSFHVSQGCCHRDDPAVIKRWEPSQSAPSGPREGLVLFKTFQVAHIHAHIWLACGCYAIITHMAFEDGTRAIFVPHKWSTSPAETKRQYPARPQTFEKRLSGGLIRSAELKPGITKKEKKKGPTASGSLLKTWNPGLFQQGHDYNRAWRSLT